MIIFEPSHLREIVEAAEAAYPEESCGLLIGRGKRILRVSRVVASVNLRTGSGDRFEVDPALRFRLMRDLEGTSEWIIGHFHSHPDHPAEPSRYDLEMAFEPELVWVITAVDRGRALHTAAHRFNATKRRFQPVLMRLAPPAKNA